ncbi:MAG: PQQ-like beta-propeller repeat protein, partial [Phycisphaerales bacterium]
EPRSVAQADEWPTFRHDRTRSGFTPSTLSAELDSGWNTSLSAPLTTLTTGGGKVFVAAKDRHCLYALEATTGKVVWRFYAGGRIDSPPTVCQGWLWFGSRDGFIYCLRTTDGQLAWRFRAAPFDRRAVVFGQLESLWPVPGSVLVRDGEVWAVAGRCSYLDGGLVLWRLEAATGGVLSQTVIDHRDPTTGYQPGQITGTFDIPGLLPDVLSEDDTTIYLRQAAFDRKGRQRTETRPHLFSPTGLLDDSWWHRSYWILGRRFYTGYRDWFRAGREVPAGRILVFDEEKVYGFGRHPKYYHWSTPLEYHLFCCAKQPELEPSPKKNPRLPEWGQKQIAYLWQREIGVLARAMFLAGDNLFVAGPPRVVNEREAMSEWFTSPVLQKLTEQEQLLTGSNGAILFVVSAEDGSIRARQPLDAPPVFDGMIASEGRLLMATVDGKVVSLEVADK